MKTSNFEKIMEKSYIVLTHYAMMDNNIGLSIFDTIEEAMEEVTSQLKLVYVIDVEVYESDRADTYFFGKQISKHVR